MNITTIKTQVAISCFPVQGCQGCYPSMHWVRVSLQSKRKCWYVNPYIYPQFTMSIPRMQYVVFKCSPHCLKMCQTASQALAGRASKRPPISGTDALFISYIQMQSKSILHCMIQCKLHHHKVKILQLQILQIFTTAYIQKLLYHR